MSTTPIVLPMRPRAPGGPFLALFAASLILAAGTPSQAKDPKEGKPGKSKTVVTPLGKEIDEAILAAYPQFWGTILVAKDGEIALAKGYGFADYKERPNAVDSYFELASISKQFTSAAIFRLEQQKKLKTTDGLEKFFKGDVPKDKKAITLDHLLHHTAGLDPELGVPYGWTGSRDQYVPKMLEKPLATAPGTKFAYSNVGYALLAAVVEVASGKSFEDYMRAEVFGPAKLSDTGFIGDERFVKSDRVTVRKTDDMQPDWTAAKWWWGWGYRGMGGVVTTAPEMLAWDRVLRGDKFLTAESRKKLYTTDLENYACGWRVEKAEHGNTKVSHGGDVGGYGHEFGRWIEDDLVVVILSNGKTDRYAIEHTIVSRILK